MKLRNVLAAASLSLVLASVPSQAHAFAFQSILDWCNEIIFASRDSGQTNPDPKAENDNG